LTASNAARICSGVTLTRIEPSYSALGRTEDDRDDLAHGSQEPVGRSTDETEIPAS